VILVGGYGAGNRGDDLLGSKLQQFLRGRGHAVTLAAGGHYPFDECIPMSRPRLLRLVQSGDLVVLGGGGLINDQIGLSYLRYFCSLALGVRLKGGRVATVGLGIEPLVSRTGKYLARLLLSLCDVVGVRDRASASRAQQFGARRVECGVDIGWLSSGSIPRVSRRSSPSHLRVAVTIAGEQHSQARKRVEVLSSFLGVLKQDVAQLSVVFLAMQTHSEELEDDEHWLRLISARNPDVECTVVKPNSYLDAAEALSTCDVAVGYRLHGLLLSYMLGLPVIAISRSSKVSETFRDAPGAFVYSETDPTLQKNLRAALFEVWPESDESIRFDFGEAMKRRAEAHIAEVLGL
jgi:polysaccharide pyruvyl transferase WcaK-like protein